MSESVLFDVEQRVACITLNEPATHNAFSAALLAGLTDALDEATARDDVSVLMLRAEGRSFSAGGDLRALAGSGGDKPLTQVMAEAQPMVALFERLAELSKPLVAVVDGAAMGGGCGIACAAAITMASSRASFGCTELQVGLFPFLFMPALRMAVGDRRALEMALSAEVIDAEKAVAWGIATRVVAPEHLEAEALAFARKMAAFSPVALRLGLDAYRKTRDMAPVQAIESSLKARADCYRSADAREGARAFLEKRVPQWIGR